MINLTIKPIFPPFVYVILSITIGKKFTDKSPQMFV